MMDGDGDRENSGTKQAICEGRTRRKNCTETAGGEASTDCSEPEEMLREGKEKLSMGH